MKTLKIALISPSEAFNYQVAISISGLLGIECISPIRIKDEQLSDKMKKLLFILSNFHDSIKIEIRHDKFVSTGSVLYDYLIMKSHKTYINGMRIIKVIESCSNFNQFEYRLLKIITDYINNTYTHIFYLEEISILKNGILDLHVQETFKKIFKDICISGEISFIPIAGDRTSCVNQILKILKS